MSNRDDVREFLTTRRAKVTPEQVGLPGGQNRRVPGLRRGEVAMLADVSVEYYSRIERGDLSGASEPVLFAIADALRLSDAERDHLFDLARASSSSPLRRTKRTVRARGIRPGLQLILDNVTAGPAIVRNGRLDVLGTNRLARAMYSDLFPNAALLTDGSIPNLARYTFLDRPRSDAFHPDWELAADQTVAILRTTAGKDPYDKALQDLVGELSTRSPEFRQRWGAHDVRRHAIGEKHFQHPMVGPLDLIYEGADLMADDDLSLLFYTAEPGSPTAERLQLLANWAATHEHDAATAAGSPATAADA
ncbi:helix-turn-helix domain-containing protein [Curtobacterium sp. RRHDQ66]|uniref:helix-turn-helix domain-containing protein n=1 Tax=Curtobacterium guangdongense TaxID=3413380 RepID=UPI003BF23414